MRDIDVSDKPIDAPPPKGNAKPAPPEPTFRGSIVAALIVLVVLTLIATIVGYLGALFAVKTGLGTPELFVAPPVLLVLALAWALSANPGGRGELAAHAASITVGAVIAAALIFGARLPEPSSLFHHQSDLVDVKVHGDDAELTFRNKTELREMPPFFVLLGETAAFTALAIAGCAVVRLVRRATRPPTFT